MRELASFYSFAVVSMTKLKRKSGKLIDTDLANIIVCLLFFTSLGLLIWGIGIYRDTIIEAKYLILTIIFGIFVGEIILSLFIWNSPWSIWIFLAKALISGSISSFLLLIINREFASTELLKEQFLIIKKGSFTRAKGNHCRQPFVYIDFYGVDKQLVFYCQDAKAIQQSSKVNLTYSRGALGFYTIQSKQVVE